MLSTEERFYLTYCELSYIDVELITEEEQEIVENAMNIIDEHLSTSEFNLTEEEEDIISQATLVQEKFS